MHGYALNVRTALCDGLWSLTKIDGVVFESVNKMPCA